MLKSHCRIHKKLGIGSSPFMNDTSIQRREPNNASSGSLTSCRLVCSREQDFLADFAGVGSIHDASPMILSSIAMSFSVTDVVVDMAISSIFSFVSTVPLFSGFFNCHVIPTRVPFLFSCHFHLTFRPHGLLVVEITVLAIRDCRLNSVKYPVPRSMIVVSISGISEIADSPALGFVMSLQYVARGFCVTKYKMLILEAFAEAFALLLLYDMNNI